eukprot:4061407-Pleurochrysis_carterae.AAC.1
MPMKLIKVANCMERTLTVVVQCLVNLYSSCKPETSSAVCYSAEAVMVTRQLQITNFLRIEVTTCTEPVRSRLSAAHASAGRSQKASARRVREHTRSA